MSDEHAYALAMLHSNSRTFACTPSIAWSFLLAQYVTMHETIVQNTAVSNGLNTLGKREKDNGVHMEGIRSIVSSIWSYTYTLVMPLTVRI